MQRGMKRVAVAAVVVFGFAVGTTQPASATGEYVRSWVHNQCKKQWLADASGGITAFANGNGYAQLSWSGHTAAQERRYWDDPSTRGYEDRSCLYSNNFVQLDYRVTRGGNCVYNACGWGRVDDAYAGVYGYHEYPPEGVGFEWEGTHLWGADEASRCGGYYYVFKSHGHAHVPHYTPHPPHRGVVDDGGAVGDPVAANAPLIADLESTYVPVDGGAIRPVSPGEVVGPVIGDPTIDPVYIRFTTPVAV